MSEREEGCDCLCLILIVVAWAGWWREERTRENGKVDEDGWEGGVIEGGEGWA